MKFNSLFERKKIIYTKAFQPGGLVKIFKFKGKKYARIAFKNRQKYAGMMPITDVLFEDIISVRVLPSNFKKWVCRQFGIKAKSKMIVFTKSEDHAA